MNKQHKKLLEVRPRFGWEINPKTRVVPSGKAFSRSKGKKDLIKALKEQ